MTHDQPARAIGAVPFDVPSLDTVLAVYGPRRVLAAAVAALLRCAFRKTRPPDPRRLPPLGLNPHLRRDVGLPPLESHRPHWPL